MNSLVFKHIMYRIVEEAKNIYLIIMFVTSYMGSCNKALWKTLGITARPHQIIKNSIENSIDSCTPFFKNMKATFSNLNAF